MAKSFGSPRVFAPIETDMPLDLISFEGSNTASYCISLFSKDTAYKMSGYYPVNILQEANLIKLLNRILFVVISAIAIVKMSKPCIAYYYKMQTAVKTSLAESYALTVLRCNWKPIISFAFPVGICAAMLIVTLLIIAKPLALPIDMIVENIFDLGAYYELLTHRLTLPNTFVCPQSAFYLRYSQACIALYLLMTVGIGIGVWAGLTTKKGVVL